MLSFGNLYFYLYVYFYRGSVRSNLYLIVFAVALWIEARPPAFESGVRVLGRKLPHTSGRNKKTPTNIIIINGQPQHKFMTEKSLDPYP